MSQNEFGRSVWVGWDNPAWAEGVQHFAVQFWITVASLVDGVSVEHHKELRTENIDSGDDWVLIDFVFPVDDGTKWGVLLQPQRASTFMNPPNQNTSVPVDAVDVLEFYDAQEDSAEMEIDWKPEQTV